jgi:hypothetical protein
VGAEGRGKTLTGDGSGHGALSLGTGASHGACGALQIEKSGTNKATLAGRCVGVPPRQEKARMRPRPPCEGVNIPSKGLGVASYLQKLALAEGRGGGGQQGGQEENAGELHGACVVKQQDN